MKTRVFSDLLSQLDIHPILMDIGASGTPPRIWDPIAPHSIYVGFDPDLREMREVAVGRFFRAIIVNEAITNHKGIDEVLFYFTKSPYCSSTLKPDVQSLSNFLFADLFIVEKEGCVRATELDSVLDRLSLLNIDWLKIDSQGTDLRIFESVKAEVRSRVLALDIEPGLIDAYVGEDLFVDAHRTLTQNGFWLSNLDVCGAVRLKRSTLSELLATTKGVNCRSIQRRAKKSPAWCEARYFRTIEWLARRDIAKRDYVLLWTFALLDRQVGFALDLASEYEKTFGRDVVAQVMRDESLRRLRLVRPRMLFAMAGEVLPTRFKRWVKNIIQ